MTDTEFLANRRRAQEEEYFQKREQHLIENLRQRRLEEAARRHLAERAAVSVEQTVQELESLGYTSQTVVLLELVPLVQVAWAEGGVSERERACIIDAARWRGIEAGSVADQQLAAWLAMRPSVDFFQRSLRALGAILRARPIEELVTSRPTRLSSGTAIAPASGGVLGFGNISPEEGEVLALIGEDLGSG